MGKIFGLRLNYEILKVYGGEIKVDTKEGQDSAFLIVLTG